MNNRTVIIISSKNQAKWSIKYIKNNPNEEVILLATTIASQLELLKNGYNSFTYLSLIEKWNPISSIYNFDIKNKPSSDFINPNNITQKIIDYLEKKNIYYQNVSIGKILRYHLFIEIEKICFNYKLLIKIRQKYQPSKIYIEKTNRDYVKPALRIFTTKLIQYNSQIFDSPRLDIINSIKFFISVFLDRIISLYTLNTLTKEKKLIFQSGGNILYYFHNFLSLLERKPQIPYLLLTFKQTVKDNLLLLSKDIYSINPSSIYINILNSSTNSNIIIQNKIEENLETDKLSQELYLKKPIDELIAEEVVLYIKKHFKQILINIDKAFYILKKTKPKLFITTHDPGISSMPYVLAAKNLKIKNMQIQHGLYIHTDEVNYYSDIAIVWGRETKFFLEKMLNKKNIYVTGFMGFDNFEKHSKELNNQKVIFSILLTIYKLKDAYFSKFLHDLFPILAKYKQFEIRIRTHPGQGISDYLNLAKFYKLKRIKINPKLTIQEFVRTSDIILSMDTTAILWAMYYQKPLFHTSPIWGKTILPTYKYNAAWIPKSPLDLSQKIDKLISHPKLRFDLIKGQIKFLDGFTGLLDDKASERLKKIIYKFIK